MMTAQPQRNTVCNCLYWIILIHILFVIVFNSQVQVRHMAGGFTLLHTLMRWSHTRKPSPLRRTARRTGWFCRTVSTHSTGRNTTMTNTGWFPSPMERAMKMRRRWWRGPSVLMVCCFKRSDQLLVSWVFFWKSSVLFDAEIVFSSPCQILSDAVKWNNVPFAYTNEYTAPY